MKDLTPSECFEAARKLASKEYSFNVSKGQIGYLPSLEGLLKDAEIVSSVDLGTIEVPLKKVVGTYSHSRSLAFAKNFMPLIHDESEFRDKWLAICKAQLDEGIRDPIKVYEYMNYYYVVEGNKRVSVLKYFNAYSITANVTRLIPKKDKTDIDNVIYYEFLEFNSKTKIYSIWFSRRKSFKLLLSMLEKYSPELRIYKDKYKHFEAYVYNPFREVYHELGGDRLPITTGDAFLEYAKICGIPDEINRRELRITLKSLIKELEHFEKDENINILTEPQEPPSGGVLSTLTSLIMPPKKLKVAFIYARTIEGSGWTYSHELGRQHIEDVFKDQITTSYVENVPENEEAYYSIKKFADDGYDVIFTTSPIYMNATLRCALEYPNIKFFNCSENRPYMHLSNYFGRTYEPRFLTGIIAGAMTKSNIIGYTATSPNPEVISSINAFTLGARMVNPYVVVKIAWTNEWNSPVKSTHVSERLIEQGADIVCNKNLIVPRDVTKKYGVYSMLCSINPKTSLPDKYLAAPIWKWGIFYEKILNNILNETFKTIVDMFSNNTKLLNFWWGMAAGVQDIYYSKTHVPVPTQKMVELMKKLIINNEYHPFTGPIYDINGNLKIGEDEVASSEEIISMDWFVQNVEAEKYTPPLIVK
jgi:basic membrane protein A